MSIEIVINDNDLPEDAKYFEIELLNPAGGAELGPGSIMRVIIEASDQAYGYFRFDQDNLVEVIEEANTKAKYKVLAF